MLNRKTGEVTVSPVDAAQVLSSFSVADDWSPPPPRALGDLDVTVPFQKDEHVVLLGFVSVTAPPTALPAGATLSDVAAVRRFARRSVPNLLPDTDPVVVVRYGDCSRVHPLYSAHFAALAQRLLARHALAQLLTPPRADATLGTFLQRLGRILSGLAAEGVVACAESAFRRAVVALSPVAARARGEDVGALLLVTPLSDGTVLVGLSAAGVRLLAGPANDTATAAELLAPLFAAVGVTVSPATGMDTD